MWDLWDTTIYWKDQNNSLWDMLHCPIYLRVIILINIIEKNLCEIRYMRYHEIYWAVWPAPASRTSPWPCFRAPPTLHSPHTKTLPPGQWWWWWTKRNSTNDAHCDIYFYSVWYWHWFWLDNHKTTSAQQCQIWRLWY